jgi:hypothetical protein
VQVVAELVEQHDEVVLRRRGVPRGSRSGHPASCRRRVGR